MLMWQSVMIYTMCLFTPLVLCFAARRAGTKERIAVNLAAYLPTMLFAALRANDVGTDTSMYRDFFVALEPREVFGLDPLFYMVQMTIKALGGGFQFFVVIQALYCWICFSVGSALVDKRVPLLSVGLLPVLMLDATFNGMRYGMAFSTACLIIPLVGSLRPSLRAGFLLIPGMIHSSMLVLMLSTFFGVACVILAAVGVAVTPSLSNIAEYFFYKGAEYSEMERSSWLSGIVPVIQISIILFLFRLNKTPWRLGLNMFSLAIGLSIVSIFVGFFSMSALRFIQVALFLMIITVSAKIEPKKYLAQTDLIIVVLGLIAVLNFMRQIFLVGPAGNVFFVPYNFY